MTKADKSVDRIMDAIFAMLRSCCLSHFSSPFFVHGLLPPLIIAVTALAGTRVMNRMSVEGGGAGPVALR
jgi:hypothetical protein